MVLLLGDSQVEAGSLPFEAMPEARLQEHLSKASGRATKVFSVGVAGYGNDQELLRLREYFDSYRADVVILWISPVNDVWNNTFCTHFPFLHRGTVKPTYWLEEEDLRGPNIPLGTFLVGGTPSRLLNIIARMRYTWNLESKWAQAHLPPPYEPRSDYAGAVESDWQTAWDNNLQLRGDLEGMVALDKSHLSIQLVPVSPRTQYGLSLTRRLLNEIRKEAEAHRALFFGLLPQRPDLTDPEFLKEKTHVLNGKYYKTSGAQWVENALWYSQDIRLLRPNVTGEEFAVVKGDAHLNARANDEAMGNLARELTDLPEVTRRLKSTGPDVNSLSANELGGRLARAGADSGRFGAHSSIADANSSNRDANSFTAEGNSPRKD